MTGRRIDRDVTDRSYEVDAELFLEKAAAYLDVNALRPDYMRELARRMLASQDAELRAAFARGVAATALGLALTAAEYERATGWCFDSEHDFRTHVRELWEAMDMHEAPDVYLHNSKRRASVVPE